MSVFIRLLNESDKAVALVRSCRNMRTNATDSNYYEIQPESFSSIPGKPFAYWETESIREIFRKYPALECPSRTARQGLATAEDFRFLRTWWESKGDKWQPFAKGGGYSPYYSQIDLVVNWANNGMEIKAGICRRYPYLNGNAEFVAKNPQFYLRPGLAYPPTALGYERKGVGMYTLPKGCIFGHKACSIFVENDDLNPCAFLPNHLKLMR